MSRNPKSKEPMFACLQTARGLPIPLLGVALGGEVMGSHARLVLRQRYRNVESKPIEAIYTFPIPGDAVLIGFAMECEGRRLEADVQEREQAFMAYDEALSKGHGAALLEQERPNIFTANVGNLLPGEETVVEVTFLQKLTADEGALRLMIPTLVAPKYIPGTTKGDRTGHGWANPTDVVPDADRISPKIAAVNYGLFMDIAFDLGRNVSIESPSHTIEVVEETPKRKRVTFQSETVALDRDIILIADGIAGVTSGVVCDKSPNSEGTFALTVVPDLFEAKKQSNGRAVVFVVDVSGSMAGASIEQAKRAMLLCLRHLSEGDLFDIIPFSSRFEQFSNDASTRSFGNAQKGLIPFTQATLRAADEYVNGLDANGGTEMLAPLLAATQSLAGHNRDRLVVLLTDGQVGNEYQIADEVAKQANGARVYTFGIGTNVSDWLLRELGKRTKGAVEFIHPGERIDEKVTSQFARATAARVDNVTLKWVGLDAAEVAPADPPALVDGEPWSIYGRYEAAGIGHVEIRGTLGGAPYYMEVPVEMPDNVSRPTLVSLWAGSRVRDLENVDVSTLGRRAETHKKRIIDLCIAHKIASQYTSFIVIEKRTGDRRSQSMPETRAVPVNAPAGWAMFGTAEREEGSDGGAVRTRAGSAVNRTTQKPMRKMSPRPAAAAFAPMPASATAGPMRSLAAPGAPPPPMAGAPPPPMGAPMGPPPAAIAGPMAPPPPMAAPKAPSPAAPMRAQAESAKAKGGGGLWERAKKAIGLSTPAQEPAADMAFSMAEEADDKPSEAEAWLSAGAPAPEPMPLEQGIADIGELFAQQLASGLWGNANAPVEQQLKTTAERLLLCVKEDVDSSHSIYGAQVQKAVEEVSAQLEKLVLQDGNVDLLVRLLLLAAAVSAGKRARARLLAIAKMAKSGAVQDAGRNVVSQQAAREALNYKP